MPQTACYGEWVEPGCICDKVHTSAVEGIPLLQICTHVLPLALILTELLFTKTSAFVCCGGVIVLKPPGGNCGGWGDAVVCCGSNPFG